MTPFHCVDSGKQYADHFDLPAILVNIIFNWRTLILLFNELSSVSNAELGNLGLGSRRSVHYKKNVKEKNKIRMKVLFHWSKEEGKCSHIQSVVL